MIIFDLCCDGGHGFEGWFASAEDFEQQLARGLVVCPVCTSGQVRRVPSAVHIAAGGAAPQPGCDLERDTVRSTSPDPASLARELAQAILGSAEDVGNDFAREARRIHYHESPERLIRGQASADECEALRDEGIAVVSLPAPKLKKDMN